MPPPSEKNADEVDLDLPALDGEDEEDEAALALEPLDIADLDDGDAFDDATADLAAALEISIDGDEAGWLVDADDARTLDVGPLDVDLQPEGKILVDDEPDAGPHFLDIVAFDEAHVADAGEEGPLADDEELREEDLPALDADEDGDVPEEGLFDRAILAVDDELRWEDRAWARASDIGASSEEQPDDSGMLAAPGDDPTQSARDGAWRMLDESGRVMAAAFLPGGSVVVALASPERTTAFLVRIQPDGDRRIIAEVDPRQASASADDDDPPCLVTFVRWDTARNCLFVGGNFGVEAYRPA
jgi:hypothetical protein